MKKIAIIGFLIIGFVFQNCKNDKAQPTGTNTDATETVSQTETSTNTATDSTETIVKEVSSSLEKNTVKEIITKIDNIIKSEDELNTTPEKSIKKKIEETKETIKNITPVDKEITQKIVKWNENVIKETVEDSIVIETVVEKATEEVITEVETTAKTTVIDDTRTAQDNWIVPSKYQKMRNPIDLNEDLDVGKSLYTKHCKSCHGKEGYGDGPKANEMNGDLGDFSSKLFHDQTDGTIFYKTTFGRNDMPEYTKKLPDDEDRWLIVNYMRTLAE